MYQISPSMYRKPYKDPRVGLRLSIFVAGKKGGFLAEHLPL